MAKKDGGPAFPDIWSEGAVDNYGVEYTRVVSQGGATLRDWFAAHALIGLLSDPHFKATAINMVPASTRDSMEGVSAMMAYGFADAMLAERERE